MDNEKFSINLLRALWYSTSIRIRGSLTYITLIMFSSMEPTSNLVRISHPKAIATWLIDNTCLSFEQVADFCGLDLGIVNAIANNEILTTTPVSPIDTGELTHEEIDQCQKDPERLLKNQRVNLFQVFEKDKKTKTNNSTRRKDKPHAIEWLIVNHPYIPDSQIIKLIGTTKNTVIEAREKIKDQRSPSDIKLKGPVELGLCSGLQLEMVILNSKIYEDRVRISASENKLNEEEYKKTDQQAKLSPSNTERLSEGENV